jgi:hypothetical protein
MEHLKKTRLYLALFPLLVGSSFFPFVSLSLHPLCLFPRYPHGAGGLQRVIACLSVPD